MRRTSRIAALSLLLAAGAPLGCTSDADPGTRVWRRRCAVCHGADGAGRTRFARGRPYVDLTDGRWKHPHDRASIRRLVADGDPASVMPPFSGRLTPAEIDAVVDHALELSARGPGRARP